MPKAAPCCPEGSGSPINKIILVGGSAARNPKSVFGKSYTLAAIIRTIKSMFTGDPTLDKTYLLELRYHLEFYVEAGKYRIIMRDLYIRDPEALMTQLLTQKPIEKYGKGSNKRFYEDFKKDIESIHKQIIKLYLDIIESIHK